MNVRRVVIVGTSHNYQIPPTGPTATEFHAFLGGICNTHLVRAIAEEMSQEALANWHVTSSLCHELAIATGVLHRYCDLYEPQRRAAGVRHEHEIKVVGFFSRWSTEKIEQEVRASHSIRERHWMKKLLDLDNWPVLFICGAEHVLPFQQLLGSASKAVAATRYRGNSRACRSSGPARPDIARLRVFSRLICPSVWPLLQCSVIAFLAASMSLRNVRANRCIT